MLNIFAAIMITAATPTLSTSAAVSGMEQVGSKMIPVLAPRNNGGIFIVLAEWLMENLA